MTRPVVVAVGEPALAEALADPAHPLPGGIRVVHWDLHGPTPAGVDPADVAMVVLENYFRPLRDLAGARDLAGLRVLQLGSAGYEHALPYLPEGVALCNAQGVHDAGTAELALGLLIAAQRGIDVAARAMTAASWEPAYRPSLTDRRVLILGAGGIGTAIARRLAAFEVDVVRVATRAREDEAGHVHAASDLPDLLPDVDAVVLAVPATPATTGLVDATFLAAMPDGALLVNVARGVVVDTGALVAEVRAGRLRAALDVTDPEPLPADHPLWHLPGVLVTPHVGGMTDAAEPRMLALVRAQIGALAAGAAPLHVVRVG